MIVIDSSSGGYLKIFFPLLEFVPAFFSMWLGNFYNVLPFWHFFHKRHCHLWVALIILCFPLRKKANFYRLTLYFIDFISAIYDWSLWIYLIILHGVCIKFLDFAKKWAPSMCSWGKLKICFEKKGHFPSQY